MIEDVLQQTFTALHQQAGTLRPCVRQLMHSRTKQHSNHPNENCEILLLEEIKIVLFTFVLGMARGIPRPSFLKVPDLFSLLDSPRNRFYHSSDPRGPRQHPRGPRKESMYICMCIKKVLFTQKRLSKNFRFPKLWIDGKCVFQVEVGRYYIRQKDEDISALFKKKLIMKNEIHSIYDFYSRAYFMILFSKSKCRILSFRARQSLK